MAKTVLPTDATERKGIPITSGVLDYFPAALAAVAKVSKAGNDQHNPGEPLHWARGTSTDQADTLVRHLMERGSVDSDGQRHSAKMAWRALALLQLELEEAGEAPLARGAHEPEPEVIDDFDDGADMCEIEGPDGWVCERRAGHTGPHACPAGVCSESELRWPQE